MITGSPAPTTLTRSQAQTQSLATGGVGTALLAVEQAMSDIGDWSTAHHLIRRIVTSPVDAATHTGLYYGAPALSFLLHAACADGHDRYAAARASLNQHVRRMIRARLADVEDGLRGGRAVRFVDYDVFYGLAGLGALLLRSQPGSDELVDVLTAVIRLTEPRITNDGILPGWWVEHDPDPIMPTAGGHANAGAAHGAAGLLALLSLAARNGSHVAGQIEAIERLCDWFDTWQQNDQYGTWWPQWLTRADLAQGHLVRPQPGRPSWCYGTPGIARALQLAAIATGQPDRQAAAETTLAECLDTAHLDLLIDSGICHGTAGTYQTTFRAAEDAITPALASRLPTLTERLHASTGSPEDGFLTGTAGIGLATQTATTGAPPRTRWDTCLLIV